MSSSVISPANSASGQITPSNPLGQAFPRVFSHVSPANKARAHFCYLIKRSMTFIENLTHILKNTLFLKGDGLLFSLDPSSESFNHWLTSHWQPNF